MDNVSHPGQLSPWFLKLPWICRKAGALIVPVLMLTLWVLLLFFNVEWWVFLLTILIPAIPLGMWLWYWTHLPEIILPAGNPAAGNPAAVKISEI